MSTSFPHYYPIMNPNPNYNQRSNYSFSPMKYNQSYTQDSYNQPHPIVNSQNSTQYSSRNVNMISSRPIIQDYPYNNNTYIYPHPNIHQQQLQGQQQHYHFNQEQPHPFIPFIQSQQYPQYDTNSNAVRSNSFNAIPYNLSREYATKKQIEQQKKQEYNRILKQQIEEKNNKRAIENRKRIQEREKEEARYQMSQMNQLQTSNQLMPQIHSMPVTNRNFHVDNRPTTRENMINRMSLNGKGIVDTAVNSLLQNMTSYNENMQFNRCSNNENALDKMIDNLISNPSGNDIERKNNNVYNYKIDNCVNELITSRAVAIPQASLANIDLNALKYHSKYENMEDEVNNANSNGSSGYKEMKHEERKRNMKEGVKGNDRVDLVSSMKGNSLLVQADDSKGKELTNGFLKAWERDSLNNVNNNTNKEKKPSSLEQEKTENDNLNHNIQGQPMNQLNYQKPIIKENSRQDKTKPSLLYAAESFLRESKTTFKFPDQTEIQNIIKTKKYTPIKIEKTPPSLPQNEYRNNFSKINNNELQAVQRNNNQEQGYKLSFPGAANPSTINIDLNRNKKRNDYFSDILYPDNDDKDQTSPSIIAIIPKEKPIDIHKDKIIKAKIPIDIKDINEDYKPMSMYYCKENQGDGDKGEIDHYANKDNRNKDNKKKYDNKEYADIEKDLDYYISKPLIQIKDEFDYESYKVPLAKIKDKHDYKPSLPIGYTNNKDKENDNKISKPIKKDSYTKEDHEMLYSINQSKDKPSTIKKYQESKDENISKPLYNIPNNNAVFSFKQQDTKNSLKYSGESGDIILDSSIKSKKHIPKYPNEDDLCNIRYSDSDSNNHPHANQSDDDEEEDNQSHPFIKVKSDNDNIDTVSCGFVDLDENGQVIPESTTDSKVKDSKRETGKFQSRLNYFEQSNCDSLDLKKTQEHRVNPEVSFGVKDKKEERNSQDVLPINESRRISINEQRKIQEEKMKMQSSIKMTHAMKGESMSIRDSFGDNIIKNIDDYRQMENND